MHVERETQVRNRLGLHARTASDFVRCARSFRSDIQLVVGGRRHSARQVMEVLLAHLDPGCRFTIVADGPDAEVAAEALETVLARLAALDQGGVEGIRAYRMRRVDFAED
jgi:phosphocarrier protein HPr